MQLINRCSIESCDIEMDWTSVNHFNAIFKHIVTLHSFSVVGKYYVNDHSYLSTKHCIHSHYSFTCKDVWIFTLTYILRYFYMNNKILKTCIYCSDKWYYLMKYMHNLHTQMSLLNRYEMWLPKHISKCIELIPSFFESFLNKSR